MHPVRGIKINHLRSWRVWEIYWIDEDGNRLGEVHYSRDPQEVEKVLEWSVRFLKWVQKGKKGHHG